jgi:hypothetical protein
MATREVLAVIVDVLVTPLKLSVPTLASIEPTATSVLLAVMVDVTGTYVIVSVPTLAMIKPTVLAVMVDVLAVTSMIKGP